MSSDDAPRREPPEHVTDGNEQDRRQIRLLLALTPQQRLGTLRNWGRLAERAQARRGDRSAGS